METLPTVYLVDTENVNDAWTSLLPLPEGDRMLLFYSRNSGHLPYEKLDLIVESRNQLELCFCTPGQNAMDFQLVSELGFRLAKEPANTYVICSKDQGYDPVCRYWTGKGFQVSRSKLTKEPQPGKPVIKTLTPRETEAKPVTPTVKKTLTQQPKVPVKAPEPEQEPPKASGFPGDIPSRVRQSLQDTIPSDCAQYLEPTIHMILEQGSGDLSKIYHAHLKQYGQKQGLEIYKKLKNSIRSACKKL